MCLGEEAMRDLVAIRASGAIPACYTRGQSVAWSAVARLYAKRS